VFIVRQSSDDIPVADGSRDSSATINDNGSNSVPSVDKETDSNGEDAVATVDKNRANEPENVKRQHRLVLDYLRMEDYPKAFEILHRLDEQGDTWAQARLGWCYLHGQGVDRNSVNSIKGVEWLRKAAEKGNMMSQVFLGDCYAFGEGVKKNLDEALKWKLKAKEQGYSHDEIGSMEDLLGHIEYWENRKRQEILRLDDKTLLMKLAEDEREYLHQAARQRLEELEKDPKKNETSNKPEKPKEDSEEIWWEF